MAAATAISLPTRASILLNSRRWIIPAAILALALVARLPYLNHLGSTGDFDYNLNWGNALYQYNFEFYRVTESNHPPIYPIMNALTKAVAEIQGIKDFLKDVGYNDIIRIKTPAMVSELLLILVAAYWLRNERYLRWTIPLLLALHPGLIILSALWPQSDPVYTLFLVLAIFMLRREKPSIAWIFFSLALLTKFQSVALAPLMVILTLRRFPLRKAITAPMLGGLIFLIVMGLFIVGSGFELAIRPYYGASFDLFAVTTANAFNIWMVIEPGYWIGALGTFGPDDKGPWLIEAISFRQLGYLMLGTYTLLICGIIWRRAKEPREFVWAAALFFGFFMLPTQMHERYLYPGVVMTILAIAQDRRLVLAALGTTISFTMNLISGLVYPYAWIGSALVWLTGLSMSRYALINLLLFIDVSLAAIFRRIPRSLFLAQRLTLAAVFLSFILVINPPPVDPAELNPNMQHLDNVTVNGARLFGYYIESEENDYKVTLYWYADRPIYDLYVARLDGVRDGEVVASTTGSYFDDQEGTWRWGRERLYWTDYWLDFTGHPRPDKIYFSMVQAETKEEQLIFVGSQPTAIPTFRYLLADRLQ